MTDQIIDVEATPTTEVDPGIVAPPEPEGVAVPAVVDPKAAERAELDRRQAEAVEHVAAAGMMPGSATYDEFMAMAVQARMLSLSGAAPKAIRGNPHVALHIVMIGRDLGISASAAVELIDVIKSGGELRPSLSPQLLNGQIRRLGLGSIVKVLATPDRCVAMAMGPGGIYDVRCRRVYPDHIDGCTCTFDRFLGEGEFTWEDARTADIVGKDCNPGDHKMVTKQRANGGGSYTTCGCNQGYITYPARMMWWRASGFAADDWFPEAGLGLYTAEELGAFVDADGRAIDVESVRLPDGYEPASRGGGGAAQNEGWEAAPDDVKAEIKRRIDALPEDARAGLRMLWAGKLPNGEAREGAEPLRTWHKLTKGEIVRATAMVKSFEDRAEKGEWGDWIRVDAETGEIPAKPEPTEDAPGPDEEAPDLMQMIIDRVKAMTDDFVATALHDRKLRVADDRRRQRLDLASAMYSEEGGIDLGTERPEPGTEDTPESAASTPESAAPVLGDDPAADTAPEAEKAVEGPDPEKIREITERVGKMNPGERMAELTRRNLPTDGAAGLQRSRLVEALLLDGRRG